MTNAIAIPSTFNEFVTGEVKDFLLDLVKSTYDNIPKEYQCRRKEICEAILSSNEKTGAKDQLRSEVLTKIEHTPPERLNLEKYGFTMKKDKHWKLKWHNKPYGLIISASSSDRRSVRNLLSDADKKFF